MKCIESVPLTLGTPVGPRVTSLSRQQEHEEGCCQSGSKDDSEVKIEERV